MNFLPANNKKIDKTDHEILSILHKEARISMTELGKRVHLTSQAVKNRLDRLTGLGVVHHYTVNVNCPLYGYKTHALIKITPHSGFMKSLLDYLTQCHSHINHCYQITGAQTLSIDSYFTDEDELQEFIDTIQKWGDYEIELVLRDILLSEGDE